MNHIAFCVISHILIWFIGSYKVKSRGIFPLYKLKPSAGFASKQGRSMYNNKKKAVKKVRNLMEEQAQDIEDLAEVTTFL